jgi:hypothetical protein
MKEIKRDELIKEIESKGYKLDSNRKNDKHSIYVKSSCPPLAVPNHRIISPGVQRNIKKLMR